MGNCSQYKILWGKKVGTQFCVQKDSSYAHTHQIVIEIDIKRNIPNANCI